MYNWDLTPIRNSTVTKQLTYLSRWKSDAVASANSRPGLRLGGCSPWKNCSTSRSQRRTLCHNLPWSKDLPFWNRTYWFKRFCIILSTTCDVWLKWIFHQYFNNYATICMSGIYIYIYIYQQKHPILYSASATCLPPGKISANHFGSRKIWFGSKFERELRPMFKSVMIANSSWWRWGGVGGWGGSGRTADPI